MDLTCESLEPVVVDLTHNDSVVVSRAWGLAFRDCGPLASTDRLRPWSQVCAEGTCAFSDWSQDGKTSGRSLLPVDSDLCP